MDGARSPHCWPNQAANRSASMVVRRGARAELGGQAAENLAVSAAGAGLLGAAQRGEVGVDGAAEGHLVAAGARR